jgi:hypothetical protein
MGTADGRSVEEVICPVRARLYSRSHLISVVMKQLFLVSLLATLVSCTTGSATRSSSKIYPAVSVAHVEVLTQRPSRSFIEIGVVTGWTNAMATPESAIRRMREKAAALGADDCRRARRPHEPPEYPEIVGHTREQSPQESVSQTLDVLLPRLRLK